ncbi:MAG: four helix bundle protein [Saprospiraceae bacterium]
MTSEELKKRFKDWAVEVVLFTRTLPNAPDFKAVRNQMVRSAPSAAANYRAACRRKSGKDFVNKLKIVEEELDETMFWLEFTVALDAEFRPAIVPLYKEADELISIIVSSIGTARKNLKKTNPQPPKSNQSNQSA